MAEFFGNSIFWIEVEKIKPNPYQPRREFDDARLKDLAESIRMYGILQPLVVTRTEVQKEDGGLSVEYELISGERRLRASKLAGVPSVPAIIRSNTDDARVKLELAIIENLQREDLNAVDRARSFRRLLDEFNLKHSQIAEKMGKSREYVSNTLRILALPEEMLNALSVGKITEGHTRPLLMLIDRPAEQLTVFKEIMYKKLTVREAESIARKIAYDKVRKKEYARDPELSDLEQKLTDSLGTRVHIERRENGGQLLIDFFSNEDLRMILDIMNSNKGRKGGDELLLKHIAKYGGGIPATVPVSLVTDPAPVAINSDEVASPEVSADPFAPVSDGEVVSEAPADDRSKEEKNADDNSDELYSVKNFSL